MIFIHAFAWATLFAPEGMQTLSEKDSNVWSQPALSADYGKPYKHSEPLSMMNKLFSASLGNILSAGEKNFFQPLQKSAFRC